MISVNLCPKCSGHGELCACGHPHPHRGIRRRRGKCNIGPPITCPACAGSGLLKRRAPDAAIRRRQA